MSAPFCVIGSINMDLVVQVPRFPKPGETITGNRFATFPGGKGANQAAALAKLGADVLMAGKIGTDVFGNQYISHFKKIGIDTSLIEIVDRCSTGVASIQVDTKGENHIVIVPGANGKVDHNYINFIQNNIANVEICLLQLEIPIDTVDYTLGMLKALNKRVILDPAPIPESSDFMKLIPKTDIITPNETEIKLLTGIDVTDTDSALSAGSQLIAAGANTIVIKAGSEGAYIVTADDAVHVPAFDVDVVDSTGAGDSFNAGLAYGLGEKKNLSKAVRFASAVGGLACKGLGAQSSMPDLEEVKDLLK